MRIDIVAVGRLRKGPEAALVADYLDRFAKTGRALGLPPVGVTEVEDRKGLGQSAEAELLSRAIPAGAAVVMLDERGEQPTSPQFAERIAGWRDGARDICFVIGGADGLTPELRARADWQISFGRVVWPHMMVRVMLSEQIYRAATILAGSPYHRV
ncbi:23S rRNA (pseudouridine(1915)-N(3))-methyltransferase RlmH [Paracoccus sp. 1_MG-2023]|uniref:23S rRNA (pseudouridine(1915)-N(3))-methyltransferase RlmH n=1 Tax=unclassified Paracoccus (in: a-proteobacteria) TaxID=2688777 RepID=UPI001C094C42|nr:MULTISPECIES: 23S rRNA (pseudouridine(1915)-N(3))-methyltransferase RlmH [unclassified Paracoccus (in: a-proteobacteria)]MBU2956840.1 23S rRNA (pseudouridine(1915)-N(3))-methyltransferase RlmH [Paracoccus sp. C2R09]MDO6670225.1 23S rRNA (pseudouridine(1915)-N(3))-methyltransferase RlmH [Paracoccus sp. 1_MG-2023]